MNTEEIERNITEGRKWVEGGEAIARFGRERIAELEAQLAEAEKPGLRHGDYGIGPAGTWIRVHGSTWWDTKDCSGPSNQDADVFIPYRLGNILADLKTRQETLKKFTMKETIAASEFSGSINKWTVYLKNHCHGPGVDIDIKDIPTFILNLQCLVYTAEASK